MPKWIPSAPEVIREVVVLMAGALLATMIVRNLLPQSTRQYFNLTGSQQ